MSVGVMETLIRTLAPTVAEKLVPLFSKKFNQSEYNLAMLALIAEQNSRTLEVLGTMENFQQQLRLHDKNASEWMSRTQKTLEKSCTSMERASEGIRTLLDRTDPR